MSLRALPALLAAVAVSGACSSSAVRSAAPTTLRGPTPTVFNCGGGAYEPATLLVVCGVDSTMITSARWTAWDSGGASGTGVVHLGSSSSAGSPARLSLSRVVPTPQGPQFSRLTATYTGSSPGGRASDQFNLAVASAANP